MEKTFKRALFFPVFLILPTVAFGFTFFLQLQMKNPIAFLTLIAGVLFLINLIFQFSNPFVILDTEKMEVKEAPMNQKCIPLNEITQIEFVSSKRVDIHRKGNSVVKVRLLSMAVGQHDEFLECMKDLQKQITEQKIQ
ncbi:MAG: hypothetical protein V2A54_14470 [Bacteroidota bacterium]